ncbi:hypothetical protein BKA69DRAFT_332394 [Paraphysoderma sedebokerense]|nr:hypothetical protein BKA69DRAFT_332394 [Paraphysoderma sedebokerense]
MWIGKSDVMDRGRWDVEWTEEECGCGQRVDQLECELDCFFTFQFSSQTHHTDSDTLSFRISELLSAIMITRLTASLRQVSRLHCQSELPSIRPASRLNLLRNNIYSTKNPRRMISSTSTFNNATENVFIHQELPTMTPLKAFKLLSVSLLGISLGSLLAVKFTEILDLTGLFHYVPEDDDDEDEEESGEDGKTERKKSDQAKIIQVIGMLDKEENQFTRKLAMER